MRMAAEIACTKINLALHVRKRRDDGYHEIETLFAFAVHGDLLSVEPAEGVSLAITGPFANGLSDGPDNLVLRAANLLAARNGITTGAAFTLEKNLPVAAGVGGGSADAAAALRLAERLWNLDPATSSVMDIAAELGADVPACLYSQQSFGTGKGEILELFEGDSLSGIPLLLVNPMVACPTGPVFQAWDGVDLGPLDPKQWMDGRNDLETPAISICPEIADVLALLRDTQPQLARMSGSGATCFALYETGTARDAAQTQINSARPHWWTMASRIR